MVHRMWSARGSFEPEVPTVGLTASGFGGPANDRTASESICAYPTTATIDRPQVSPGPPLQAPWSECLSDPEASWLFTCTGCR